MAAVQYNDNIVKKEKMLFGKRSIFLFTQFETIFVANTVRRLYVAFWN